jgi:hypothetical protein
MARELIEHAQQLESETIALNEVLTRELDVAMHGERGAARQASLCDLIEPAKRLRAKLEAALMGARERNDTVERLRADKRGLQAQLTQQAPARERCAALEFLLARISQAWRNRLPYVDESGVVRLSLKYAAGIEAALLNWARS